MVKTYLQTEVHISKEFKLLIDNEYQQYLDETGDEETLEMLENIEYV